MNKRLTIGVVVVAALGATALWYATRGPSCDEVAYAVLPLSPDRALVNHVCRDERRRLFVGPPGMLVLNDFAKDDRIWSQRWEGGDDRRYVGHRFYSLYDDVAVSVDRGVLGVFGDKTRSGYSMADGELLWSVDFSPEGRFYDGKTLLQVGDTVIRHLSLWKDVRDETGRTVEFTEKVYPVRAIDLTDGTVLWESEGLGTPRFATGKHLVVEAPEHQWLVLDPTTGDEVYRVAAEKMYHANDTLYALSDGRLDEVNPRTGARRTAYKMGLDPLWDQNPDPASSELFFALGSYNDLPLVYSSASKDSPCLEVVSDELFVGVNCLNDVDPRHAYGRLPRFLPVYGWLEPTARPSEETASGAGPRRPTLAMMDLETRTTAWTTTAWPKYGSKRALIKRLGRNYFVFERFKSTTMRIMRFAGDTGYLTHAAELKLPDGPHVGDMHPDSVKVTEDRIWIVRFEGAPPLSLSAHDLTLQSEMDAPDALKDVTAEVASAIGAPRAGGPPKAPPDPSTSVATTPSRPAPGEWREPAVGPAETNGRRLTSAGFLLPQTRLMPVGEENPYRMPWRDYLDDGLGVRLRAPQTLISQVERHEERTLVVGPRLRLLTSWSWGGAFALWWPESDGGTKGPVVVQLWRPSKKSMPLVATVVARSFDQLLRMWGSWKVSGPIHPGQPIVFSPNEWWLKRVAGRTQLKDPDQAWRPTPVPRGVASYEAYLARLRELDLEPDPDPVATNKDAMDAYQPELVTWVADNLEMLTQLLDRW